MESEKNYKSLIYILGLCINSCFGAFFFGYCLAVPNLSFNTLSTVYEISDENKTLYNSIFSSATPFTAGIGASLLGYLLSKFGRN